MTALTRSGTRTHVMVGVKVLTVSHLSTHPVRQVASVSAFDVLCRRFSASAFNRKTFCSHFQPTSVWENWKNQQRMNKNNA